MTIASFQHSLNAFLSGPDKVLVIRGHWGVGKTYSWDAYVNEHIAAKTLKQIAYSYVSLFGKSSLAEVRASVFQNARPLSPEAAVDEEIDRRLTEATRLRDRLPWIRSAGDLVKEKAPFLGWLTITAKSVPFTDKFAPLLATLEYSLVGNYLICIDDLERKGSALSIREVMGLMDELAQRKSCKVVLIFNDKTLASDPDRAEYEAYREKVVDSEIEFSPAHAENLEKVFPAEHYLNRHFSEAVVALDLKNIRVLKKLRRMTDLIDRLIKDCHEDILREYANHAAVLLWSYYMRSEALPHPFIVEQLGASSWAAYFRKDKGEPTEEETRYKAITSAIRLEPSVFDSHVLDFLKRGYFDLDAVQKEIEELNQKAELRRASGRLSAIWNLYTDTFAVNHAEIVSQLQLVLGEEVQLLSISEYSGALSMLESLGADPTELMRMYIDLHKEGLTSMDRRDSLFARRVSYEPMRIEIVNLGEARRKLDLDDVAYRIAKHQGWNPEDIEFLSALNADDYYRWIQSSPSDLSIKLRSGLLTFRSLSGSRPEDSANYSKISADVTSALRRFGSESEIGKLRIKHLYDIDAEA
jgi:hypothetical protein